MQDYLTFRRMITPIIIQVLFWIGVGVAVLAGLASLASTGGAEGLIACLIIVVVGPLMIRIYCELLILMFRINDTLMDIKEGLRK